MLYVMLKQYGQSKVHGTQKQGSVELTFDLGFGPPPQKCGIGMQSVRFGFDKKAAILFATSEF